MPEQRRDWSDFNFFVAEYVPRQTIPILRKFASHIELRTRLSVGIRAGDKKAEIVEKIIAAFRALRIKNDIDGYSIIRAQCEREGNDVYQRPGSYGVPHLPAPTFGGVPNIPSSSNGHSLPIRPHPGQSTSGQYRPASSAAGPSRNGWQTQANTTTAYNSRTPVLQDWKPSPMWKPLRALTNMEMLPDILPTESSHARRERKVHVTLQPDIIEKLNYTKSHPQAHPQYSVRIFCTSSDYYRAPNTPHTPANSLINNKTIPIEYPSNPDVYVDEFGLPFKDRGLRGKAGSAPPFDLDKGAKGLPKVAGRMTGVSMGHTGPTVGKKKDVSKKFYFQVVYCEITTPVELQNRIDRMVPATAQESLNLLRKKQDDDDDIQFGQSRLRLKDPLASMRLTRPVRSTKCSHLSCFEPKWWIATNEKHPQWNCPLCGRELRFDELIVDGFTLEILATVPEDYDEVVIEGDDNAWHTEDGKYGSAAWMAANAAPSASTNPNGNGDVDGTTNGAKEDTSANAEEDRKPSEFRLSLSPDPKGKRKAIEILSSDDEDEQPLAKVAPPALPRLDSALSSVPTASRPTSTRPPSVAPGPARVIDLTLSDSDDSDDEDAYRGQGVNSSSLPPLKALGANSSVRSPLAPPKLLPFNSNSNLAPHRPEPTPSPVPPSNPRPSWDRTSEPNRYNPTSNHSSTHNTLQPPRRADTWRPSDQDAYRDNSRDKQRNPERPEDVDPYADWDPDPPYMGGTTPDELWDQDWYRRNRVRPDHRSNTNTTAATTSNDGAIRVPRSPKKVARPRPPSPRKPSPEKRHSVSAAQANLPNDRLFNELFGGDDRLDRPGTPEAPVASSTTVRLPSQSSHRSLTSTDTRRKSRRPRNVGRASPSDLSDEENLPSPPSSPDEYRPGRSTTRSRPPPIVEIRTRRRQSSSSLSELYSSDSGNEDLAPPPPHKRARTGPTFDNLFPEDEALKPAAVSTPRSTSGSRPSTRVRNGEAREGEPIAPPKIMLRIKRPGASVSRSPATSVTGAPSTPQTPTFPPGSHNQTSTLRQVQKTPRSGDDEMTIDDNLQRDCVLLSDRVWS